MPLKLKQDPSANSRLFMSSTPRTEPTQASFFSYGPLFEFHILAELHRLLVYNQVPQKVISL